MDSLTDGRIDGQSPIINVEFCQELDEYIELYDDIEDEDRKVHLAMVTHIDDGVKLVMEALHEAGMENDTLVVFMSDVSYERSL